MQYIEFSINVRSLYVLFNVYYIGCGNYIILHEVGVLYALHSWYHMVLLYFMRYVILDM